MVFTLGDVPNLIIQLTISSSLRTEVLSTTALAQPATKVEDVASDCSPVVVNADDEPYDGLRVDISALRDRRAGGELRRDADDDGDVGRDRPAVEYLAGARGRCAHRKEGFKLARAPSRRSEYRGGGQHAGIARHREPAAGARHRLAPVAGIGRLAGGLCTGCTGISRVQR